LIISDNLVDKTDFDFSLEDDSNVQFSGQAFWLEYDTAMPVATRGLSSSKYIETLSNSCFTLCPPGFSKITHRVVEALVRGSIPIINANELELYNMNLRDNQNCIAVYNNDWTTALKRALSMPHEDLVKIHTHILSMKDEFLLPQSFSRRLRQKIGL
jgi:Exostosin family